MRLRRRWLLAVLAGLVLALPLLLWTGYAVLALLGHEHFYHGLPTSYWSMVVRRANEDSDRAMAAGCLGPAPPVSRLDELLESVGLGWGSGILNGDPATVPVLADLLGDDDQEVRWMAATALGAIGPPAETAVPALTRALGDPYYLVRWTSADALGYIGPGARSAVPALTEALGDAEKDVRESAANALRTIDPEAARKA